MSAAFKFLTFLAFFVVASEAFQRIHSDDVPGPIKNKQYSQSENDRRRLSLLRKLKEIGVTEPSIKKLEAVFTKYEKIYKKEPKLTQDQFETKYGAAYFREFSNAIDSLPSSDKEIHKNDPTLNDMEFGKKYKKSYFEDFSRIIDSLPSSDKQKVLDVFRDTKDQHWES
ncbi:unnamed protein product [Caenorhabditis auriculariae]|uniref:Uncharacterized protein n=1 Tax=Caenorhabditis auriculariae TaxID=2777116 RepID=A0A8S1HML2_9PELO|nr:unnamed protein product [Caenorhabditis auriculariae]